MTLSQRLTATPLHTTATASGTVQWRGSAPASPQSTAMVLLHGIGSASASWVVPLEAVQRSGKVAGVMAWDAPGYGASTPLPMPQPVAADYARVLWDWLDAQKVDTVFLVGHSLGALMAGAAYKLQPQRVLSLLLLSPAQGYARAEASVREAKLRDRLKTLHDLGPQGMAERRGAAMLSATASAEQVAYVQGLMAQIHPDGYAQATHMLSNGDLASDLAACTCPLKIASGSADTITPPQACAALAASLNVPYQSLGPVGHACAVEVGPTVATLLAQMLAAES